MKKITLLFLGFSFSVLKAQTGIITTVAGNGTGGYSADGIAATAAELYTSFNGAGVSVDRNGNIYIADSQNNRIRKVNTGGVISTIAGTGTAGYSGDTGPATAARISDPICVRVDNIGNIYFSDAGNAIIREINTSGIITTIAGRPTNQGYSGDNGPATAAELNFPTGLALDNSLNVYIADEANNRIREFHANNRTISLVAGNGTAGYSGDNGPSTSAELNNPTGVAVDDLGNVYAADRSNDLVREVTISNGHIKTYAGIYNNDLNYIATGLPTTLEIQPTGISCDVSGNIFISDGSNSVIYEILASDGQAYTIAGNGIAAGYSGDGGQATAAELNYPFDVVTDADNNVFIADENNNRVRKITNGCSAYSVVIAITAPLECNGNANGQISASISSMFTPYTYSWSLSGRTTQNLTGLSAGTYTVTIKDASGCSASNSVTLTQPPVLGISIVSVNNVICNGGTGTATANNATGGTSPYVYRWTPAGGTNLTSAGLSAGTYTITVTDSHGCTASAPATITQPAAMTVSVNAASNENCNGGITGSANASVSGGTSPYTYSWAASGGSSSTATGLSAGTYTVHVTGYTGCTASATVTITQPAPMSVSANVGANVGCNGGNNGSAAATTSGGTSPYTYSWAASGGSSATATGLTAGTYTVHVTGFTGCTASVSIIITQPASVLGISLSTVTNIICNGETGVIIANAATGGTSPYNYSWSSGAGTRLSVSGLSAGAYNLTATDNHGCTVTISATITQPAVLGISIVTVINVNCNVMGSATAGTATGGSSPYTYNWTPSGGTNLTASGLSAGTYSITVTDNHGCSSRASAIISQPANSLGITISSFSNVSCFGGTGNIAANAATGGTSPYTYNWSPGGGSGLSASGLTAGAYTITVTDNAGCTSIASATITQPLLVGISISSVANVSCNGGVGNIASNAASGGTSPYVYNWTPSGGTNLNATGLSAGNYVITVTDNNGCTASASAVITQPAVALGITISLVINVSCSVPGSIIANAANGGTSPYTYNWSPGGGSGLTASGLSAGTYTLSATDNNGCSITASATVTQPVNSLGITISAFTNPSCFGETGSAAFNAATGGTPPYTYSWTSGGGTGLTESGLSAGIYSITVMDNIGCSASAAVTISQPTLLAATTTVNSNVNCNGNSTGAASVSASGGTGAFTYLWAPLGGNSASATGLSAGTFTVTVTDNNGCTATSSANITQPSPLTVTHDSVAETSGCNGLAAVIPGGGAAPYTYLWTTGGQTTDSITGQCSGTYCCTITDNNGCSLITCVTVNLSTGIKSIGNSSSITIYPDPGNGYFTIEGVARGQIIELYNYTGQKLFSEIAGTTVVHFTIYDQPNGVYLIRITDNEGNRISEKKVVKMQ